MPIFIDIVASAYENLLSFEAEKKATNDNIEDLEELLTQSDSVMDAQWTSLMDSAQSLLRQIDRLETQFTNHTQSRLEQLENLETKIDGFIEQNEQSTIEIKQDMVDAVGKMQDSKQDINDELEELETIVTSFNEKVNEIEPQLEQNLENTGDFINNVMLRGLQNYQEVLTEEKDNLDEFYDEEVKSFISEQSEDFLSQFAEIKPEIQNLGDRSQDIITNITEAIALLFDSSSSELQEQYQELFDSLESITPILEDKSEEINDQAQTLFQSLDNLNQICEHCQDDKEATIDRLHDYLKILAGNLSSIKS